MNRNTPLKILVAVFLASVGAGLLLHLVDRCHDGSRRSLCRGPSWPAAAHGSVY